MADPVSLINLKQSLPQRVKAAHEATHATMTGEAVSEIVRQVITSLAGDVSASDLKFYAEVEDLAKYIRSAKRELATIKPKDISATHIPIAHDELDAVVGATEDATNKIMDVCDRISAIAGECTPEISEKLIACTTTIFEACNFQDITGQRITKVVQTLKHIDTKVEQLVTALGEEVHHMESGVPDLGVIVADDEKYLLNGPQLPQNAIDQSAIDQMLSGGDKA